MNTLKLIHDYDIVVTQLIEDIKKSDFKIAYFLKLLNLKSSFFYKKMREKRFTNEEVKLLSQHLYPEQYQAYQDELLSNYITKAKEQLQQGKGINFETTLANTKEQYNV